MSGLEFVASLVASLAWPAVALAALLAFRRQLTVLMGGPLSRLTFGPFTVKWRRTVAKTEVALSRVPTATVLDEISAPAHPGTDDLSPLQRIGKAFQRVEKRLRGMLVGVDPDVDTIPGSVLGRAALEAGRIDVRTASSFEGLVVLRDLAVSGSGEISPAQAAEFEVLASGILYTLSTES